MENDLKDLLITGEQLQVLVNQIQDIPYRHSAPVLNFIQYLMDVRDKATQTEVVE